MNQQEIEWQIGELAKQTKLDDWQSFVEELKIPSELYPAFLTNRPELVRVAQRRVLSAEEADALYKLIAGLLETNNALRMHAQQVAELVQDWMSSIQGMQSTAHKIRRFANFERPDGGNMEEV